MNRKLRKIKQSEYYSITITLLYCIFLVLLLISMLTTIVYFAKDNFILTIAGILFVLFFVWHKLNKLEKIIYE